MEQHVCNPGGTPKWYRDATLNDSDKSFTVPTGKMWFLKSIYYHILTSGTVGNRTMWVSITNGTDVIWVGNVAGNQPATTNGTGLYADTVTAYGTTTTNVPTPTGTTPDVTVYNRLVPFYLPAGYVIRVYDTAAIAAATDDLTVILQYVEYDV